MKKENKMWRIIFSIIFINLFFSLPLLAERTNATLLFLTIPAGAKPTSLGGAYTARAENSYGLFWNPAGINKTENSEIYFSHNAYLLDLKQEYIGFVHKFKNKRYSVGVSMDILDYGKIDGTLITSGITHQNIGEFTSKDYSAGVSFAMEYKKKYQLGASLKYINSKISDAKADGIAMDFGWIGNCQVSEIPLNLGFVIQNLGQRLKYDVEKEELPLTVKFGIANSFDITQFVSINTSVDNIIIENDGYKICAGIEFEFSNNYFIRAGYNDFNEISSGLTFGLGANLSKLSIDYSYSNFGDLNNSHVFGILYKF